MEKHLLRSLTNAPARTDWVNVFLISSIWLGMVVLVNPIGNFPLNDDWAYGWTVKTLLETGEYRLSDWAATNLLPQAIWGTIFCLPFGFSFTALRISTLILGLLGVLTTYGLLREAKASSSLSFLGALTVVFNPVYFVSSNSFNSDIPSFTFTIVSLYFIVRGLKTASNTAIIFGILISFISILNRQSGIVVLLAFSLATIAKKGTKIQVVALAFLPAFLGLVLQSVYSHWLDYTNRTPLLYGFQIKALLETFSGGVWAIALTYLKNASIISVYLGLFLLPFLAICFAVWIRSLPIKSKRLCILVLLLTLGVGAVLVLHGRQMPFVGNVLEAYGLGPQALDGYYSFNFNTQVLVSKLWKFITVASFLSAGMLILYSVAAILRIVSYRESELEAKWFLILIVFTALLYLGAIAGLNEKYWFDRYLIFLLPILMMLVSELTPSISYKDLHLRATALSLVGLLVFAGFTISATHDYLSWNRVRWQALNNLIQDAKISAERVDGGAEFNGWYFGNRLETCNSKYQKEPKPTEPKWEDFACLWEGWGGNSRNYLYSVSFAARPGYEIDKQYLFRRWLPWRQEKLYVLKKMNNSINDSKQLGK